MEFRDLKPPTHSLKEKQGILLKTKIKKFLEKRFVIGKYAFPGKFIIAIFSVLFVLILLFFAYYLVFSPQDQADPKTETKKEIASLTNQIGKFMDLPQGEEPTLATVSDREKLAGQLFFAKSQNGDKVLVYSKAKKAILFRPSEGRIIEFATLSSDSQNNCPPTTNQEGEQNLDLPPGS